jgi:uncharacterized protein YihD (DUF1040 family)
MGFPYGADEDAAYLTTWLELHKLKGINKLAELSNIIDNKYNAKIDLEKIRFSPSIDLQNISLLMKGPGLFDYFYQKTKNNHYLKVVLENCIDPIFVIPLAQRLAEKLDFISARWLSDKNKKIGMKIIKNKVEVGELDDDVSMLDDQVILHFVKNNESSQIEELILCKKEYEINESTKQKNLEESLNPDVTDWNVVSKIARRTFVPISEESRKKGAGGGDDND